MLKGLVLNLKPLFSKTMKYLQYNDIDTIMSKERERSKTKHPLLTKKTVERKTVEGICYIPYRLYKLSKIARQT